MRRTARVSILALAMGMVGAMTPTGVSACISEQPTFGEAVHGARAIARVTIVDGFDDLADDPSISETYRVDRVLKGSLPGVVTIAPAWTSLCHDSIGYYAGDEDSDGKTVVVAFDLRYFDQVIHPMWVAIEDEMWGSAGVPAGITTLAELETAIRAELGMPETSTQATQEPRSAVDLRPLLLFVATIALMLGLLGRRRRPV